MNPARRLAFAAAALAAWAFGRRADAQFSDRLWTGRPVSGKGYEGVVFAPADTQRIRDRIVGEVTGYWKPVAEDVALFEALLRAALVAGVRNPDALLPTPPDRVYRRYIPDHLREIIYRLDHGEYYRQYFGFLGPGGRQRLFVNFFHTSTALDIDWRITYVQVTDGGAGFWRIQFDLHSKRYQQFEMNGFA
jgi:hypothetical protein